MVATQATMGEKKKKKKKSVDGKKEGKASKDETRGDGRPRRSSKEEDLKVSPRPGAGKAGDEEASGKKVKKKKKSMGRWCSILAVRRPQTLGRRRRKGRRRRRGEDGGRGEGSKGGEGGGGQEEGQRRQGGGDKEEGQGREGGR